MNRHSGPLLVPATLLVTLAIGMTATPSYLLPLLQESGPVEGATAVLWFALAASIFVFVLQKETELMPFAVLALLAGGRELDIHHRFTTESFTKISYWLNMGIPFTEKLIVLAIALPIAAYIGLSLIRGWPRLRARFAEGDPATYTLLALVVFVVLVKLTDAAPRNIRYFTGEHLNLRLQTVLASVEEIGEMMLPAMGFLALGQFSGAETPSGVRATPSKG
ncbi:hypothetical protein V6C03_03005 [Methyloligella sp. 2.7D]|uniref:hypothetical protein n=1 Tax=unclassified Methyloligella TaxID=2625955 RepID=UPI00157BD80B|nr:hypothetical protein [Methyloligella sp. GL2]QKP76408.1 hypothetical protein HT051_02415 [Methyloligella sp. GL2]